MLDFARRAYFEGKVNIVAYALLLYWFPSWFGVLVFASFEVNFYVAMFKDLILDKEIMKESLDAEAE